jgi:protein involved in polysaccharide export with SLBB domain
MRWSVQAAKEVARAIVAPLCGSAERAKERPSTWKDRGWLPSSFSVTAILLAGLCSGLSAQQIPAAPNAAASPSSPAPTDANVTLPSASGSTAPDASSRNSLTATQIDRLLQQRPDVVVELKSLVADQLRQQGTDIQADDITDEMLYSQIATSADMRSSITLWLHARGYISEDDMQRPESGREEQANEEDGDTLPFGTSDGSRSASVSGLSRNGTSSTTDTAETSERTATTRSKANRASSESPRNDSSKQHNVTDEPEALHLPAPYNLHSLRDLYTQIPQDGAKLTRFGSGVFLNRDIQTANGISVSSRDMPIDVPVGPDYVLGTGDGLTINLWGGISQSLTRVVDREGKIVLPEAGSLVVAGLTLEHAQTAIADALKQQFHNVQVDITITRLRSVRIYVVGDVQKPGAYDLSSLSTPLNALYAAGGPTGVGSLRIVRHYRGAQLVREVDLYDFLLHGIRMDDERLQSGDTLLVPPAGPQVAIFGMVKRPAIYEFKGGETLVNVLEDAGGATVAAALNHITIERIQPNQQRETVSLEATSPTTPESTLQAIAAFKIKDGDRIHVAPILPYSERVIYVEGHVARPGKYPYRDGMQISDVLRTYQDLLPEPASKAEIVRLVPPDLHPEAIPFDVPDVLIGNSNLMLQPFDTIRLFGRYETDSPQVTIRGEVMRPGVYALSQGMTAAQLVKMSGGFKRDALLESADLTSYSIQDDKKVVSQRAAIPIGAAANGNRADADVRLKPGDVLTIHQISGWNDIGASIELDGEVTYPGSYGLQEGERLSSVLLRAGGFRSTAYPAGAVLVRTQVRELEDKSRVELIHQIENASASARLSPALTGQDQTANLQAVSQQQDEILQRLRSQPASGRLIIHVTSDISSWANTDADIELRSGDVLTVPKRPGFVLVSGQVYNASAITFVPGKNAGWYLGRAGGTNDVANRKEIFVVRANGSVVGRRSGTWYSGDVLATRLDPGDVIVVPQKILGGSLFWRNLLTVAQISSSIAITAAVAGLL